MFIRTDVTYTTDKTPPTVAASTTTSAQTTAITGCHMHETTQFCVKGNGEERPEIHLYRLLTPGAIHVTLKYGQEVEVVAESAEASDEHSEHSEHSDGENCHFHAGVEHCVGGSTASCERKERDYNINLRVGLLFVILATSGFVAGDSVFITLFVVVVFHQMFEGLALGARIAAIDTTTSSRLRNTKFLFLPLAFALVTPTGMAIGIGVLNTFNGNDPSTIVALGTLDSLSAGILLWVGFVDMWAGDWLFGDLFD
ncbi:putative Zinc-regulated transporter 2 [Glarea lozoyensis 74030]|uniref:Putative Zinc-regulated transporter 2 n=1 Tax=Glarea lozoyensis (strain ATCC 74030 / MF5533) TaxID=1104152 RepID=H0ELT4_GLAL7|nr:putative Zinc-regulated transporter 2 [Glarea lozoyensis 74030]